MIHGSVHSTHLQVTEYSLCLILKSWPETSMKRERQSIDILISQMKPFLTYVPINCSVWHLVLYTACSWKIYANYLLITHKTLHILTVLLHSSCSNEGLTSAAHSWGYRWAFHFIPLKSNITVSSANYAKDGKLLSFIPPLTTEKAVHGCILGEKVPHYITAIDL